MISQSVIKNAVDIYDLKQLYGWPTTKPDLPFDGQGWCCNENVKLFNRFLNKDTKLVIELGAWLGLSTRFILQNAINADVITIDTWEGSKEHHVMKGVKDKLKTLHTQFLANCWDYRDRLIPIKNTTINALAFLLIKTNLQPNLIYVDASHEQADVYTDLVLARMFDQAIIMGDDWTWDSVRNAVLTYCRIHNLQSKLHNNKICWWIEP